MGVERRLFQAALFVATLTVACTPPEPIPTSDYNRLKDAGISNGNLYPVSHDLTAEQDTNYKYWAKYCEGDLTYHPDLLANECHGFLYEAEGEGSADKGEPLTCPQFPEVELLSCYRYNATPPIRNMRFQTAME